MAKKRFDFIKTWQGIVGIISGLVLIVGTAFATVNYFAKDCDLAITNIKVAMNNLQLEMYKLERIIDEDTKRLWDVEDRIHKVGNKPLLIERKRELLLMMEKNNKKLDKMKKDLEFKERKTAE